MVISLNDAQLKIVMVAAAQVPYKKRVQFLGRVGAMLQLHGRGSLRCMMYNVSTRLLPSPEISFNSAGAGVGG